MPTSTHTFVHLLHECRLTSANKVLYASCNIQNLIQQYIYRFHILLVHQFLHVPQRQEFCVLRWVTRAVDYPECYKDKGCNAQDTLSQTYKRVLILFLVFNISANSAMKLCEMAASSHLQGTVYPVNLRNGTSTHTSIIHAPSL